MNILWELIIFVVLILGGSFSLKDIWWDKNKKKAKNEDEARTNR